MFGNSTNEKRMYIPHSKYMLDYKNPREQLGFGIDL